MPNNLGFPDPFETSGRYFVDQIYWIHFLMFRKFFETVMVKKEILSLTTCGFAFVCFLHELSNLLNIKDVVLHLLQVYHILNMNTFL